MNETKDAEIDSSPTNRNSSKCGEKASLLPAAGNLKNKWRVEQTTGKSTHNEELA